MRNHRRVIIRIFARTVVHILYLHQYFVPPDGSGGTRSYEMAKRLVKGGHQVTLLTTCASFPGSYQFHPGTNYLSIDGIKLHVLRVPYSNKFSFFRRIWAFASYLFKACYDLMKVKDVDLVFATSTPLTIAIPGIFAKFRYRCKMVFEVRDLWPELPIAIGALRNSLAVSVAKYLEKYAYKNSEYVVALSPGMAKGVAKTGYPTSRIEIIPNSCDVALFRCGIARGEEFLTQYPYLKGGPIIVYAGTLGEINGVGFLTEVASELTSLRPEIKLLIVGDGKEKEKIKAKAEKLGVLGKNLWMIPPISKKDIPGVLAASTVSISLTIDLPLLWNNSANKFFDALAAGRPVIINHEGWQADFLRETGAGLVLPPRNALLAAKMIEKFVMDPERLRHARRAATRAANEVFNRDLLAKQLMNVLEEAGQGDTS